MMASGVYYFGLNYVPQKWYEEQTMMPQVEAESLVARSNGFSFDIEKDWIYNQYGDKVIINNVQK